jgi:hypothetical protein
MTRDFQQILLIDYSMNLHKMLNTFYTPQMILLTRVILLKLISNKTQNHEKYISN